MAIQLKNLLLDAEDGSFTIDFPDGTTSTQQFRQRSFTYGDNANTDPPLIVKDFNGNPLPPVENDNTNPIFELVGEVTDNFVRGGAITLAKRAATDVERLGKVLISPNGLAWSAAQLALARTNPIGPIPESDPEAAANPDRGKFIQAIQRGVEKVKNKFPRNQVTLPLNLVLSAGVSAAGVRFRKDGLLDAQFESGYNYDPTNGGDKYEHITINNAKVISENALESNKNFNKLLNIYGKHILSADLEPSMESVKVDSKKRKDFANNYLLEYGGGAHSLFGVGRTAIKKYRSNPYDSSEAQGYLPAFNSGLFQLRQAPKTPSSKHVDYRSIPDVLPPDDPNRISKRKPIEDTRTRINLYKLGDPGLDLSEQETDVYDIRTIDKITAANIFKRENLESFNGIFKDYIKFRIAVVDTDNPMNDNVILFRALLGSIGDSYTGNWNSYKYNGRAEELYTYSGFNRGIEFSFKIHAQSRHEQKPIWRKLNYLVAQTAPEYKNRRMRGVFSRLTIGDWMNEIPGFFTNISLNWSTSYPWEIRHDNNGTDRDLNEYPHILDVNCTYQPIHSFAPTNSPTTPFILPEIGVEGNRKYGQISDDEVFEQNRNGVAVGAYAAEIGYKVPEPIPAKQPEEINNPALENRGLILPQNVDSPILSPDPITNPGFLPPDNLA